MTPIRGILFDFGDTLVSYPLHSKESQLAFIIAFVKKHLQDYPDLPAPAETLDRFVEVFNKENPDRSVNPMTQRLRDKYIFGDALTLVQAEHFEREIIAAVCSQAKAFAESRAALVDLKRRGLRLGIVSNLPWGSSPTLWRVEFQRHGFGADLIDTTVTCMDVGYRKPHPAGIMAALAQLRLRPEEALFIGDNPKADMGAAHAAGCRGVLIDRSGQFQTTNSGNTNQLPILESLSEINSLL